MSVLDLWERELAVSTSQEDAADLYYWARVCYENSCAAGLSPTGKLLHQRQAREFQLAAALKSRKARAMYVIEISR